MEKILALDCSIEQCSIALWLDDGIREQRTCTARHNAEELLTQIQQILISSGISSSELTALAVGAGPGSFTGVRLATAVVQGLALAWQLPVRPISSLGALVAAAEASGPQAVLAVVDARMGEVYAAWYDLQHETLQVMAPEAVMPPDCLTRPVPVTDFAIVGNGYASYNEQIVTAVGEPCTVLKENSLAVGVAILAARMGSAADRAPDRVEPIYVRNKVALTSAEQQMVRNG